MNSENTRLTVSFKFQSGQLFADDSNTAFILFPIVINVHKPDTLFNYQLGLPSPSTCSRISLSCSFA